MARKLGVLVLLGVAAAACSGGTIRKVDGGAAGTTGGAAGGAGGAAGTTGGAAGTTGGAAGTSTGGATAVGGAAGTSSGGTGGTSAGGAGGSDAAVDAPGADGAAGADAGSMPDAPVETKADAASDAGAPDGSDAGVDGVADVSLEQAAAHPVTVGFTGKVVTVADAPLGFDATVRLEAVSGSFTYDLRMVDQLPADPKRGKYEGFGITAFTMTVKGHTVTGSGSAQVQTEDLNPDTFRFIDGKYDAFVRVMKFDGVAAPNLMLLIAITDSSGAMLSSEALPDPFPTLDITSKPHTFSLQDDAGTLLMQLDTLTPT